MSRSLRRQFQSYTMPRAIGDGPEPNDPKKPEPESPPSSDNLPLPPDSDDPDRGDWTVYVDGKGYARPTVDVVFLGTVVHEKQDPFATELQQEKRRKAMAELAARNQAVLEDALFILSQSPTGRDVLEQMTREGYSIIFDDRRTGDRGAGGLCDPSDKKIILRSHDNPEYLALLLGHECVHAVQNAQQDLFPSTRHKPDVGIRLSFAIEADAYAQQSQIALELAYGDPAGPADQILQPGPLTQMRQRFPDIMKAAEKAMTDDASLTNGACVAAAFEAFYDNFHLRTFYEDAHIEWANNYAPQIKGSFPWFQKHFSRDVDSQSIKDRIRHRGQDYLNKHAPHLVFDDARHAGLSEVTAKKVENFYRSHLPKLPPPQLKKFGMHMKDAVEWVLGLRGNIHVFFSDGHDRSKPPLRPPPRRRWGMWE